MEEYASSRFTLSCTSAPILPRVIERAATTQINHTRPGASASNRIRSRTANAAALGAVDMNPTTGAGAPSYTSGVQTWNGAAATLNPRPTNISAIAANTSISTGPDCSRWAMMSMLVDPVAPNMSATPYKKNAVANEPSRKYFNDASLLAASLRRNPARMYVEIDEISSPMKISTSSMADDISAMPTTPNKISA